MKFLDDQKKRESVRKIIYGITDRRDDPLWDKVNDFIIDNSPVRMKEKGIFFDSLQLLVNSGVRFVRALEILAERQRNIRFQRVLNSIVYDMIQNGESFSRSMGKYPDVFSSSEIKMILSGEMAGKIEETLESIAKQIKKNIEIQIRLRSALTYPATVVFSIIMAAIIIMIFVVPKFIVLFSEFPSAELPFATRVLIGSSWFLQHYWWFLLTVVVAIGILFRNWKRTESGILTWHRFILRIPFFHSMINNIQTVQIASNFATLMQSGIPVVKALQLLSEIIHNRIVGLEIFAISEKTIRGQALHKSFSESLVLDRILGEVLEIGEKSGRIPEILQKTASQYEIEVDAQLRNISTLIEPLIIIVVGGAVVFMAMAIMTPIFRLQELFIAG
ncbi:type II secretion system F family protein [Candidatus Gracilibacteria bacterium]|nr:type II secretion system F family protein [Candidatus Gracilibacteria bacterium]